MAAYYNEIDPFAAQWLRNLVAQNLIAPGDVDTRSIEDVSPDDLKPYAQCHFFAGIAGWSLALRNAGWSDDRAVWTGSCPCQPFSTAGKGAGFTDERHLWPAFFHLIQHRRPAIVFGEQVASKDALAWFDLVQTDLEAESYAARAVDLCAAGVGAPHIRQRMYWVANANDTRLQGHGKLRDLNGAQNRSTTERHGASGSLDNRTSAVNGFWQTADWLYCRDNSWRPVEPALEPLVNGFPGRVGQLRAYGNAISPPLATVFIESVMELHPWAYNHTSPL